MREFCPYDLVAIVYDEPVMAVVEIDSMYRLMH